MLSRRAVIALPLVAPLIAAAQGARPIGLVEEIEGAVEATGAAGRRRLSLGADVWLGDRVRADAAGGCAIRFDDDTLFDIGAASEVTLDRFVYAAGSAAFGASVVAGGFRFLTGRIAALDPPRFTVTTPAGVIGVRGTHVAGTVTPEGVEAMLLESELETGAAVFRNDAGETALDAPGDLRRWRDRGAIGERLRALSPDQRAAFLERFRMGERLRRFQDDRAAIRQTLAGLPPQRRRAVLERLGAARTAIRQLPPQQRPAALRRLRDTLRQRLEEAREAGGFDGGGMRERREQRFRDRLEQRRE